MPLFCQCCQVYVSATGRSLAQRILPSVRVIVIRCNHNPLRLQWVGRRGQTKKYIRIEPHFLRPRYFSCNLQGFYYMTLCKPSVRAELVSPCWLLQACSERYDLKIPHHMGIAFRQNSNGAPRIDTHRKPGVTTV